SADVVDLTRPALLQDEIDRAGEVLDVQPVTHLAAVAVDGQLVAVQRVQHHQRDQLLRILAGGGAGRAAGPPPPRPPPCRLDPTPAGRRPPSSRCRATTDPKVRSP